MSLLLLLRATLKRPRGGALETTPAPIRAHCAIDPVDPAHVARYKSALGFRGEAIPVTYYYLLAQRAHLLAMLEDAFPLRVAGMIHVANELVEHAPLATGRSVAIDTVIDIQPPAASGAIHCVLTSIATQDGITVFTCTSRYLKPRGRPGRKARTPPAAATAAPNPLASWRLASSDGRKYAAISGDWNPIHLWNWSARLMGLRQPIIHGMHTVGKACAGLEAATGRHIVSISARFKAPIPLGAVAYLESRVETGTFVVSCDGRPAVDGTFADQM